MTKKTFTQKKKNPKHSNEWQWEETPEVIEAIRKLEEQAPDYGVGK
tara:strand:- start:1245 stop:1382 length:138 start_codon:yes stop_codon:yes gene_type:complete